MASIGYLIVKVLVLLLGVFLVKLVIDALAIPYGYLILGIFVLVGIIWIVRDVLYATP